MAGSYIDLSSNLAVSQWERMTMRETREQLPIMDRRNGMIGPGLSNMIVEKDDLRVKVGKDVTFPFRYKLSGEGVVGRQRLEGREEGLNWADYDQAVNLLRHASGVEAEITEQWAAPKDQMAEAQMAIATWLAERYPMPLHLHAAGYTMVTKDAYRGMNAIEAINAPATGHKHILRPGGHDSDDKITTADVFSLNVVQGMETSLAVIEPKIRRCSTPWGNKYAWWIAPEQAESWLDTAGDSYALMRSFIEGGMAKGNPLANEDLLGGYRSFLFFQSNYVPPGMDATGTTGGNTESEAASLAIQAGVRRSWIGGAGALFWCWGRGNKPQGYSRNRLALITDNDRDFGNEKYIGVKTIFGIGRPRFTHPTTSAVHENGIFVVPTFAAVPTSTDAAALYKKWTDADPGRTISASA